MEAYEAAMYSMAHLNRSGAKLMHKYGTCMSFKFGVIHDIVHCVSFQCVSVVHC